VPLLFSCAIVVVFFAISMLPLSMEPFGVCQPAADQIATFRRGRGLLAMCSSGDVRADVLSQNAVNQRLIPNVATPGFCAESVQHLRVQADRDELSSVGTDWRSPDTSHRA
jgi:hypothetical protein